MFKEGQKVSLIGAFTVHGVQDDYVILDPFEKGTVELTEDYIENGFKEYDSTGNVKEFDGFNEGDFFKFGGTLEVVRSNQLFTKLKVEDGTLISVPNHKILEVE